MLPLKTRIVKSARMTSYTIKKTIILQKIETCELQKPQLWKCFTQFQDYERGN